MTHDELRKLHDVEERMRNEQPVAREDVLTLIDAIESLESSVRAIEDKVFDWDD
jgi:hypothetical protein